MFGKRNKSVSANDAFVTLISVAQDDPEIRQFLVALVRQSSFQRESLLNTMLQDMTAKGAPRSLTSAMAELLNDDVAKKVAEEILR